MQNYISKVVNEGSQKTGQYMTFPDAQWSKLGNSIVVRRSNGEFLTFLDHSKGGVAHGWDAIK
jgi:hypothetical protein